MVDDTPSRTDKPPSAVSSARNVLGRAILAILDTRWRWYLSLGLWIPLAAVVTIAGLSISQSLTSVSASSRQFGTLVSADTLEPYGLQPDPQNHEWWIEFEIGWRHSQIHWSVQSSVRFQTSSRQPVTDHTTIDAIRAYVRDQLDSPSARFPSVHIDEMTDEVETRVSSAAARWTAPAAVQVLRTDRRFHFDTLTNWSAWWLYQVVRLSMYIVWIGSGIAFLTWTFRAVQVGAYQHMLSLWDQRRCPHCEYDLTSLRHERCPECGLYVQNRIEEIAHVLENARVPGHFAALTEKRSLRHMIHPPVARNR